MSQDKEIKLMTEILVNGISVSSLKKNSKEEKIHNILCFIFKNLQTNKDQS